MNTKTCITSSLCYDCHRKIECQLRQTRRCTINESKSLALKSSSGAHCPEQVRLSYTVPMLLNAPQYMNICTYASPARSGMTGRQLEHYVRVRSHQCPGSHRHDMRATHRLSTTKLEQQRLSLGYGHGTRRLSQKTRAHASLPRLLRYNC